VVAVQLAAADAGAAKHGLLDGLWRVVYRPESRLWEQVVLSGFVDDADEAILLRLCVRDT
jgi:hypothetical protein